MRIAAEVRNPDSVGAKCEWPTKLNIILESAQQNPFGHLHHGVITRIHVAEKTKNPFFAKDLTEKGGAIDILLRQRRYLGHLHQEYSKMFEVPETAAKLVKTAGCPEPGGHVRAHGGRHPRRAFCSDITE